MVSAIGAGPLIVTIPVTVLDPVSPLPPLPMDPDSGTTETGGTSDRELQATVETIAMMKANAQTVRYCIYFSYAESGDSEKPRVTKNRCSAESRINLTDYINLGEI